MANKRKLEEIMYVHDGAVDRNGRVYPVSQNVDIDLDLAPKYVGKGFVIKGTNHVVEPKSFGQPIIGIGRTSDDKNLYDIVRAGAKRQKIWDEVNAYTIEMEHFSANVCLVAVNLYKIVYNENTTPDIKKFITG